ncbi:MAG TPA: toxin-antitoxin system YwqK family antitoxin [Fibrobacteria bacterium]|nr:toxin-antitoxin system YwqK family antitoxin [Fibrobacteria bacterium]
MHQSVLSRFFRIPVTGFGPAARAILAAAFSAALLAAPAGAAAPPEIQKKEIKFPDGKIKEKYSYYLDDKKNEVRDGLDEEFFGNGAKKGEIPWQDGKENGLVIYYYADGRKSYEANYKEGKKNGYATVWYQTGQKQWQTVFRDGLTHGVWREWYADGKKKFEANYNDGKLEGLATWWHDTGRLWQERSFQAGVLVKGTVREWDRAGRQTFPPPDTQGMDSNLPTEPKKQDSVAGGTGPRSGN